jgi:hypothetical protein
MSEPAEPHHAESYRTLSEIEELVRGFETCTLPHSRWTHRAHLTVALWYLAQGSEKEATERMRDGILRLNQAHGVPTTKERGYHETITLFWLWLIGRDAAKAAGSSIVELANTIAHRYSNSRLPFEYYSRDLLMSWEARTRWVEPDLKPLN